MKREEENIPNESCDQYFKGSRCVLTRVMTSNVLRSSVEACQVLNCFSIIRVCLFISVIFKKKVIVIPFFFVPTRGGLLPNGNIVLYYMVWEGRANNVKLVINRRFKLGGR